MSVKQELYNYCVNHVNQRLQNVEKTISSNQKALDSETKSSAGDKHETGRAMLQLEMEKASQQLAGIIQMKETLIKVNIDKVSKIAHLGSVVYTNTFNYFLCISCGEIIVSDTSFFAVSVSSHIGKLLLGKQEGDDFSFNGNKIIITSIV